MEIICVLFETHMEFVGLKILGNPGPRLGPAQKCDAVKPKKKPQCFLCLKRTTENNSMSIKIKMIQIRQI
jgi:hypothetical protein